MHNIIKALKAHLGKSHEEFVRIYPYADGDTENGFIAECNLDMTALFDEIDKFCESFNSLEPEA